MRSRLSEDDDDYYCYYFLSLLYMFRKAEIALTLLPTHTHMHKGVYFVTQLTYLYLRKILV